MLPDLRRIHVLLLSVVCVSSFFKLTQVAECAPFAPYANHSEITKREEFHRYHEAQCQTVDKKGRWCAFSDDFQSFLQGFFAWKKGVVDELVGSRDKGMGKTPHHYSQVHGLSFGGFRSQEEKKRYKSLAKRAHPTLFIHGGLTDAGDMLPLAFLHHRLGEMDPQLQFGVSYTTGNGTYGPATIVKLKRAIEALHAYTGETVDVVAYSQGGPNARKVRKTEAEDWKTRLDLLRTELTSLDIKPPEEEMRKLVETTPNEILSVVLEVDLGPSIFPKSVHRYISIHEPARGQRRCNELVEKELRPQNAIYLKDGCDEVDGNCHGSEFLSDLEAQTRSILAGKLPMLSIYGVPDFPVGNKLGDDEVFTTHFPGADPSIPIYFDEPPVPSDDKVSKTMKNIIRLFYNHVELPTHPKSLHAQLEFLGFPLEHVDTLVRESPPGPNSAKPSHDPKPVVEIKAKL